MSPDHIEINRTGGLYIALVSILSGLISRTLLYMYISLEKSASIIAFFQKNRETLAHTKMDDSTV